MKRLVSSATIALLALIATAAPVHAKDRIGGLLPELRGLAHVNYTYDSSTALKNSPTEKISYHEIDAGGHIPIPITERVYFTPGLKFNLHHFILNNVTNYIPNNSRNAYFINLQLDALAFLSDNWFFSAGFWPTLSSDLKDIGSHDLQWLGQATAAWAFSDSASLIFGVFVSKQFWIYFPVPLVGFVVRPKGAASFFELETILPQYLRMNFRVASFCRLFLKGEFEGFQWDVKGGGGIPNHFLEMMEIRTGAGVGFTPIKGLDIELWGGVNPFRKYRFRDRANNSFSSQQKMSWFANGGIVIHPELFGFGN